MIVLVLARGLSSYQVTGIFNLLIDMAEKISGVRDELGKWSGS
jgi:hypothetical protein